MTRIGFEQIQPGWEVYANDGEHLGAVTNVNDTYITMSKGLFLPKDYFIPASGIDSLDPDQERIVLSVAKADLDRQGWDDPALAEAGRDDAADFVPGDIQDTKNAEYAGGVNETQGAERAPDTQRVQRYEEELRAEKSSQQAGEVRLTKDVTEEEQGFDVPVTREDVEVRRVAVDRPAGQAEQAFDNGDTVRVPVREEQVQVTKEPRVVEEIEIRKTPRQETQRVSDTVRKERVNVERQGDVNVRGEQDLVGAGADRFQGQSDWDRSDRSSETRGAGFEEDVENDESDPDADPGDTGSTAAPLL